MRSVTRKTMLSALLLTGVLMGCVHEPPPPSTNLLDGYWTSTQLGYDITINGMIGLAEGARTKGLQDGDPVLRLSAMEGVRITARQWMPDGQWHTVAMERNADGTLNCSDGSHSWTMTRTILKTP